MTSSYQIGEGVSVIVDPADSHKTDPRYLFEMCGYLPQWALNPNMYDMPVKDVFNKMYPFGLFEINGATIGDNGKMSYPGDPDLYPFVEIDRFNEKVYIYQSAIVAIVSDKTTFVTRMD